MKKITIIIAALIAYTATLWAQEPTAAQDTIATFKVENSSDVTLSSGKNGSVAINIAGYSITLAEPKSKDYHATMLTLAQSGMEFAQVEYVDPEDPHSKIKRKKRSKVNFVSNSKFGLIHLSSPDYSSYSAEQQGFLNLRQSKSIYYGLDLVGVRVPLDYEGIVTLKSGVNLMCYNFTFDNDVTLDYQDGAITPVTLDGDYKKSKLTTAYAAIPLSLAIKLSKNVTLEPGVYAGLIFNSHTKYKEPNTKSDYLRGVNQAIAGASLAVGYKGTSLYCDYNFTSLFEQGRGPETQAMSLGIAFKL